RRGTASACGSVRMSELSGNTLNRTLKIELDEGRARTRDEAEELVKRHMLQVVVGRGVEESRTRQANLGMVLNCAPRAFVGAARVEVREEARLSLPWHDCLSISEVARRYGCSDAKETSDEFPTLVIGELDDEPAGSVVLHPT